MSRQPIILCYITAQFSNASFAWNSSGYNADKEKTDNAATLVNISVRIPRGSLVAVVGRVGSGKSSLLSGLLGDIDRVSQ